MPRRRPTGNRAPTMRVFTVLAHRVCAYKRIGRTPEIMTGDFPDMLLRRSPAENLENVRFLRRLHGSNDRHDDEEVGAPPAPNRHSSRSHVVGASRPARRAVRKLSERPEVWRRIGRNVTDQDASAGFEAGFHVV